MELSIEKSLIDNSDYLNRLAKEVDGKSINDIDSNLLYEVAYAYTYLDIMLMKGQDNDLSKNLSEVRGIFEIILDSVPYDELDRLKSGMDYKKLLKIKYGNLDDGPFEKSYSVDEGSIIKGYLVNKLPKLVMISLIAGLAMNADTILPFLFGLIGLGKGGALTSGDTLNMAKTFNMFKSVIGSILAFYAVALVVLSCAYVCLDLLYIIFPTFRDLLGDRKKRFISEEAINSVEYCMDKFVSYKTVKSYDRVERNKVWLDIMLKDKMLIQNDNKKYTELESELKTLKKNIKGMEKDGKLGKDYYLSISKIEFLRDEFLRLCDEG